MINVTPIPLDALINALGLAAIGMVFVFATLFGVEILLRIIGKVFGPKPQVPESPPVVETKQGG